MAPKVLDPTNHELSADNVRSTVLNTEQSRKLSTESVKSTESEIVQPKKNRKRTCVISDDDEIPDPKGRKVKLSGKQTETGKTEWFRV